MVDVFASVIAEDVEAVDEKGIEVVAVLIGGGERNAGLISSILMSCSMGISDNSPPACGRGGNFAKA